MPSFASRFTFFTLSFVALLGATQNVQAADPSAAVTRGEFKELLVETLMNDPEVVMKALYKLREKQEEENSKATAESFAKHRAALQDDKVSPAIGSAKPDVTIVVFFDYQCGFCKKILPTLKQIHDEDKNVRIIFREYPILSENSVAAARTALAINRLDPKKYFAYHTALMQSQGAITEDMLLSTAEKIGIDREKLKSESGKQVITDLLTQNRNIGEELGIRGTPALFVGDKLLPGAVPYETLKRVVEEVRGGKS